MAKEPARRPLEQDAGTQQHRGLGRGRHLAVERLDRRPELAKPGHLACCRVGAGDLVRCGAGLVAEPVEEGRAGAVDEVVRDPRRDDLAPERVPLQLLREPLAQAAREVERELAREVRIVRKLGREQRLRERDLRVREQDRELGRRQPAPGGGPVLERLDARQELELAVEHAGLLEAAHVALMHLGHRRGLGRGARQRLRLVVVVAQHERGHLVGHLGQELVPLLPRQVAVGDDRVEQDLDVDLVVGAVDARRVVDRVHEDAAAAERVGDPRALSDAEVAALADHARPQVLRVDADGVVRPVADLGVPLVARLHVGADAAVPEQVDRRVKDRPDQLAGRQQLGLGAERRRTSGESGIDLAVRGKTPPPGEISAAS